MARHLIPENQSPAWAIWKRSCTGRRYFQLWRPAAAPGPEVLKIGERSSFTSLRAIGRLTAVRGRRRPARDPLARLFQQRIVCQNEPGNYRRQSLPATVTANHTTSRMITASCSTEISCSLAESRRPPARLRKHAAVAQRRSMGKPM